MLRFYDSEVYIMYENTIKRSELFSFFCSAGKSASIIVVLNDEEVFQGIITYDALLNSSNGGELIQTERLVLNDEIWINAKRLFENKKIVCLPVFSLQNQLIYFAFNDNGIGEKVHLIDHILDSFEKNQNRLFIKELYPRVQVVCIHDFNEWAYRFYNILVLRGIPVVTIGVKWRDFGVQSSIDLSHYPDYSVMNVYAEGTELIMEEKDRNYRCTPCNGFDFILEIAQMNMLHIDNYIKKKMDGRFLQCNIPDFNHLADYSLNEYHRFKTNFHLENISPMMPKHLKDEHSIEVYGVKFEDGLKMLQQDKDYIKSRVNIIEIENTSIVGKRYGNGKNIVYLIGPCIIAGVANQEQDQLAYSLFSHIDRIYPGKFSLITIPIWSYYFRERELVLEQLVKEKDVIIISIDQLLSKLPPILSQETKIDIDLLDCFNSRPLNEAWFSDIPIHTNGTGNRAIAKELYNSLLEPLFQTMDLSEGASTVTRKQLHLTQEETQALDDYIKMIRENSFDVTISDRVGAIVMNCNPFTKGHLYLIEEASRQVDYLYIFVVEEDRSFFPFEDRIELVKKGVCDLNNVKVLSSGSFILSYHTLPSYFSKDTIQNITIDATMDIRLFAEFIAPALKITVRFVGEEPLDNITNQYNREMERSLGDFGIDFVEIKRKTSDEEVISASKVRRLLKSNSFSEIEKIVPKCTYDYLLERYTGK